MFKQLMQAGAIGVCQLDACRLGGVNEVLAVMLLAARFGVPVCPHAGGVGLCEYVQHLSLVDYIAIGGDLRRSRDRVRRRTARALRGPGARSATGATWRRDAPGYSIEMHPESLEEYAFPGGKAWCSADA